MDGNPAGRALVLRKAREQTLEKSRGHYPALLAAIDVIAAGYAKGVSHGYREESRRFGEMAMTDVSRQLIFLFFATTALKKDPGVDPADYPELPVSAFEPLPVEKIAILGAGFMGAGIASVAVQHGTLVRLKDADHGRVAKGYAAVREILRESVKKKRITSTQYSDYMALVGGTVDYSGFGNVDLVIEAVSRISPSSTRCCAKRKRPCTRPPSLPPTPAPFRSRRSRRRRTDRSASSACTSSRRCTRCRCSR